MDTLTLFLAAQVGLAIFAILALQFGEDSRDGFGR
jgi:hypothetical protein